ncbi:MAG: pyruvate carboxylase subunit B [Clostridiales bacterium]|nr:pyruvate carboxylase subunit B [Clostridiales bacterium]MDY5726556.1 pyruvate carboxylase subunit B [Eubacteriales bacterium]
MKKVAFTETVLRDANQSLIATRLSFDKFEKILPTMDKAGYYSVECWGGATFDACLRFLKEDPWERLRKIRAAMPNSKLQMLFRGQNMLGYKHYPDDVVRKFIQKSVENGIDIIRIFDALNDTRNVKVAIEETVKRGAVASGAISYTTSPVHTLKNFVGVAEEMKKMGATTICVKDMAGVMGPQEAYDITKALKEEVGLPVILHTHCTTGLAYATYLKGIEAGADVIDTASSCFSGGTSQPATETFAYLLQQLGYQADVDMAVLKEVNDHFKPIRNQYIADGVLMPRSLTTDTDALTYKVPGGMLSNLFSQLKQLNALDRLEEVLAEVPNVRKDLGYPPLVTPMSQMVGVQATQNVLQGRYNNIGKEVKSYLRGEYGKAPGEVNQELVKKALGDAEIITCRFADTLKDEFEETKAKLGDKVRCDEDVLSYIAFPQVAETFFAERKEREERKVSYSIEKIED